MRIAVVSDIHSNLTAFEAVRADLRQTAPDLIFHGGDPPHGASPIGDSIGERAAFERHMLGEARLEWLRALPSEHVQDPMAPVHASSGDSWSSPALEAPDVVAGKPFVV